MMTSKQSGGFKRNELIVISAENSKFNAKENGPISAITMKSENKTVLDYLINLKPALPYSVERPHQPMSVSELRRWIEQGAVLFNGERVTIKEIVDFPVFSLVFFPRSANRRTTLI